MHSYHLAGLLSLLFLCLPIGPVKNGAGNFLVDEYCQNYDNGSGTDDESSEERLVVPENDYDNFDEDPDTTVVTTEQTLEAAINAKEWSKAAAACYDLGSFNHEHLKFDAALELSLKGIAYARKAGDIENEAKNLFGLGVTYVSKFDYPRAMENLLEGLKLTANINDPFLVMQLNNWIGLIYKRIEEYEKARKYLLPAYDEALHLKTGPIVDLLMNLGNVEENLGNYQAAIGYYKDYLSQNPNSRFFQVLANNNIGNVYLKAKEPANAMTYYKKAYEVEDTAANPRGRVYSFSNFAAASQATGEYESAIGYGLNCLALNQRYKIKSIEWLTDQVLANCYEKTGNYQLANEYFKKYLSVKDSITSKSSIVRIAVMDAAYKTELETEKKQLEIVSLQKDNDLNKLQVAGLTDKNRINLLQLANMNKETSLDRLQLNNLKQKDSLSQLSLENYNKASVVTEMKLQSLSQQNQLKNLELSLQRRNQLLLAVGIVLSLITFVFYYRRYRLKRLLELEKIRSNIAADFHDELGSTLSSIALHSEMAMWDNSGDTVKMKSMLTQIGTSSRAIVSSMQDMIWSIQPEKDSMEEVVFRMREYALPLAELKNIELNFNVSDKVNSTRLSMDKRKNLYLVFKEAVNNAVKYSNASTITIDFTKENHLLNLLVKDNGIGFDTLHAKAGNGLKNMQKRAHQSGGKLALMSSPGSGSQIIFTCPVD
ncbi:MAG: ATP-binding protein [Chitinophagaceae bacterium]